MNPTSQIRIPTTQPSTFANSPLSSGLFQAPTNSGAFKVPNARRPSAFTKIESRNPVRKRSESNSGASIQSYLLHLSKLFTGDETAKNEALSALSAHPIFKALMSQRSQISEENVEFFIPVQAFLQPLQALGSDLQVFYQVAQDSQAASSP